MERNCQESSWPGQALCAVVQAPRIGNRQTGSPVLPLLVLVTKAQEWPRLLSVNMPPK
jgi:hypothetical protein